MSELFNPYAVSVLGSPLPQKAPPQLRAEGRPMTRPQLDMARFVFGRFLEQARLSYVPNPTQQGFLPDGSRFRIVDVAGVVTMQVWPVGGEESTFTECPSGLFVQRSPLGINNKKFETWLFTFAGKQIKEGALIKGFAGPVHKDRGTPHEWGDAGGFDGWDRYHQFFARKNATNFCYAHGVLPTGEIAPLEKRVLRGGLAQGCDKHKPDAGRTWVGYTSEGKARFVHVEIPYIHNPGGTAGSNDNGIIEFPIKITSSVSGGEVYYDQAIPMGGAVYAGATMELLDITPDGRRALFMHVSQSFYMDLLGRPMRQLQAIWEVTVDFDSSSVTAAQLRGPTGQDVHGDNTMYRDLYNNHRTVQGQDEGEFVRIYTPDFEVDVFDTIPDNCADYTHYWDFKLTYSNDNYTRIPRSEYKALSEAAYSREYRMKGKYDFTLGWGYGTFVVVEPQTNYYHSAAEITYGAYYREMESGDFVVEYLIYEGGVGMTAHSVGDITIDGEPLHIRVERHVSRGTVNGVCKTFSDKTFVTGGGSVTLNYECNSPATGDISATISNGVGIIETDGTYSSLMREGGSYKREVIIEGINGKDSVVRVTRSSDAAQEGPTSISLTGDIIEGAYTINDEVMRSPSVSVSNTSYSFYRDVAKAEFAFREKNGRPRLSDNYQMLFNSNITTFSHERPIMEWWEALDGVIAFMGNNIHIEVFLTTLDGGKLSCAQAFIGRFDYNGDWLLQSRVEYSKTLSPDGLVGEKHILDYERDTIADIWDPDARGKGWRAPHQLRDNATYNPITKQVLRHTLHPATWMGVYKKKPEIDGLTPMTKPVMTTEKELPIKDGYVLKVDEDTETYHVEKE